MNSSMIQFVQWIPPLAVLTLLVIACYFFWSRYVQPARRLCIELERIGSTIASMADGEESMRRSGIDRVFLGTALQPLWKEFSNTLHAQTGTYPGRTKAAKTRLTIPASYFFSAAAVIDRPLGVEYFKHLPGILTGVGIIGTFSGLLFGLSSFDASNAESMSRSVGLLMAGVRDAFYASAAAITAAMMITHWEKWTYRKCLEALDILVGAINSLFQGGVEEEYLAELVSSNQQSVLHHSNIKDQIVSALAPLIKNLESSPLQQQENLREAIEAAMLEVNKRLVSQIESALNRQVRSPLEELSQLLVSRPTSNQGHAQQMAVRVLRARDNAEADTTTRSGSA